MKLKIILFLLTAIAILVCFWAITNELKDMTKNIQINKTNRK